MKKGFCRELAISHKLSKNDYRVILCCMGKTGLQVQEIRELLRMPQDSVRKTLKKLQEIGVLREEISLGVKRYMVNESWSDEDLPGQMSVMDFLMN